MYLYVGAIEKWFERYDKWVHQAERAKRLGIAWQQEDKVLGVIYHSVEELDLKAEEMRMLHKNERERCRQQNIEKQRARGLEV